MQRAWLLITFILVLLFDLGMSFGFDLARLPDFSSREWLFVKSEPVIIMGLNGQRYRWGRGDWYLFLQDPKIVGYEEFAFNREVAHFRMWGTRTFRYQALREDDRNEKWFLGPPGSGWLILPHLDGGNLNGIWIFLMIPTDGKALGRYFPNPDAFR
jgi:hypothetical protein